jgi:hypothetical protein
MPGTQNCERIRVALLLKFKCWAGERPGAMPDGVAEKVSRNACPGEGCGNGRSTACKSIIVYDTSKQKRRILARLIAAEKVIGVTGVVIIFRPG